MTDENKTPFDQKAATWDENPVRLKLANDVADAMIGEIKPTMGMDVLDFGCGTGLVTLRLQPLVRSITGVDSSQGMLDVLRGKIMQKGLRNAEARFIDLEKGEKIEGKFHLVVSSMTLHHVPQPAELFRQIHELLLPGGAVGIADLDKEDGSFHEDNTGVFHFGFDRAQLKTLLADAGFIDLRDTTAATIVREGKKEFPVFLIIGRRS